MARSALGSAAAEAGEALPVDQSALVVAAHRDLAERVRDGGASDRSRSEGAR